MAGGRLTQRVARLDGDLVVGANAAVRAGGPACSTLVGVLAERLAGVEVALLGGLLLVGRRGAATRMLLGVGVVYVASELLGNCWPRARPFVRVRGVEPLVAHTSGRSFPSRHVASGVAMALVGRRARPSMGNIMGGVALLLGVSRVAAGLHYPTDVVAGALLGALVGRFVRG